MLKNKIIKKIKYRDKRTRIEVIILFICIVAMMGAIFMDVNNISILANKKNGNLTTDDEHINLSFAGDVMLSRYVTSTFKKQGVKYFFDDVDEIMRDSDWFMVNLENSVIKTQGSIYTTDKNKIQLTISEDEMNELASSEIDMYGLANNHIGDSGYKGVIDTLEIFENNQIKSVGLYESSDDESNLYRIEEFDGVRVAFVAVTDVLEVSSFRPIIQDNAVGVINTRVQKRLFEDVMESATQNSDLVIVSVHWGDEYSNTVSKRQEELTEIMVENGANLIVGHHPHVLQPVTIHNGVLVINSLGNFVFDQVQGITQLSTIATVNVSYDKTIDSVEFTPILIKNTRPTLTKSKNNIKKINSILSGKLNKNIYKVDEDNHLIIDLRGKQ
ncbi:MAG: CapA family protein [Erysipelothrix sp.]